MANPNIVNVANIFGKTDFLHNITTTNSTVTTNSASSNKIFKINTILFCARVESTVTCEMFVNSTNTLATTLCQNINLPTNTTFVLTSKSAMLYLPEDRDLRVRSSSDNNIGVVISYEEIS